MATTLLDWDPMIAFKLPSLAAEFTAITSSFQDLLSPLPPIRRIPDREPVSTLRGHGATFGVAAYPPSVSPTVPQR